VGTVNQTANGLIVTTCRYFYYTVD